MVDISFTLNMYWPMILLISCSLCLLWNHRVVQQSQIRQFNGCGIRCGRWLGNVNQLPFAAPWFCSPHPCFCLRLGIIGDVVLSRVWKKWKESLFPRNIMMQYKSVWSKSLSIKMNGPSKVYALVKTRCNVYKEPTGVKVGCGLLHILILHYVELCLPCGNL